VAGESEVMPRTNFLAEAGCFSDAVHIRSTYNLVGSFLASTLVGDFSYETERSGTIDVYYGEAVGLIYSVDINGDGGITEARELTEYSGYEPVEACTPGPGTADPEDHVEDDGGDDTG
jgi:hypothetical protein